MDSHEFVHEQGQRDVCKRCYLLGEKIPVDGPVKCTILTIYYERAAQDEVDTMYNNMIFPHDIMSTKKNKRCSSNF
jgi:hypothetical protein